LAFIVTPAVVGGQPLFPLLCLNYPDAKFAMTHPDPAVTVPSTCSTVDVACRTAMPNEALDRNEPGSFLLEHVCDGMDRAMRSRGRIGDDRFCDVTQHEFEGDPVGTLERVYDFLDIEFDDADVNQITSWASENRPGARAAHRYRAEDYGLSTSQIREMFAAYISRFALITETGC
jgi:hypothetical protein